jgi:ABC-type branched-subunit amino acid transport system ATPase component
MSKGGVARQTKAQFMEIIFHVFAALGAFVHSNAGRLVEHEDQTIAIQETGI